MTSGGPGEDTALIAYRITTEAFTNLNVGYASALGQVLNRWGQRYRRNTAQHRSDTRCNAHHGNGSDRVLPPDSLRQRHSCGRGCRDSFRDTRKACSGQQRMTLAQTSAQFEKTDDIQLLLHNT